MTTEKQIIVTHLRSGMSTLQISKMLKRNFRTVIRFFTNDNETKGKKFRIFLIKDVRQLKTTIVTNPVTDEWGSIYDGRNCEH